MRCSRCAGAVAYIRGDAEHAFLWGEVHFAPHADGVLVTAGICGLPESKSGFFGFHIHDGESCTGAAFADTGNHYDTANHAHPNHAGDLPPLMKAGGRAYLSVVTDRFSLEDVIGKTVVIHNGPDDFTSQPAGNAGRKIACGRICRR